MPPIDGLHDISPIVSQRWVTRTVRAPVRAAAVAASQPACPPPITTTSASIVVADEDAVDDDIIVQTLRPRGEGGTVACLDTNAAGALARRAAPMALSAHMLRVRVRVAARRCNM